MRDKQGHQLVRQGRRRTELKQPRQGNGPGSGFLVAFASCRIFHLLARVDATGGDFNHLAAIQCEMAAKPELTDQQDFPRAKSSGKTPTTEPARNTSRSKL